MPVVTGKGCGTFSHTNHTVQVHEGLLTGHISASHMVHNWASTEVATLLKVTTLEEYNEPGSQALQAKA